MYPQVTQRSVCMKYKVIIRYARDCEESTMFDTEEEARQFIKDVVAPGTNSHGSITAVED